MVRKKQTNFQIGIRDANDFYIHYNNINIGSRGIQQSYDVISNYAKKRTSINTTLKNQYKRLLNANLNGETIKTLSQAMEVNQNEMLSILNEGLIEHILSNVDASDIYSLNEIVGNKILTKQNFSGMADEINGEAGNVFSTSYVLEVLSNAVELIEGAYGDSGALAALILDSLNNSKTTTQIGQKMNAALSQYLANNDGAVYHSQTIIKLANALSNLAFVLQQGSFKKNKKVTSKNLARLIQQNIISTNIAEGIVLNAFGKGLDTIKTTFLQTGTQTVKANGLNLFNEWSPYGQRLISMIKNKTLKVIRKADLQSDNLSFKVHSLSGEGGFAKDIELNVGISAKFYSSQPFANAKNKITGSFKSGKGGSLANAVATVWPIAAERYFIYNYIAHDMYTEEIKSLILQRMIIRLFSSAGGAKQDFAQIIFLNGYIVSVWDLVQYVMNNDLLSSKGITLYSISTSNIKKDTVNWLPNKDSNPSVLQAWIRSRKVNQDFHRTKIEASLHLNKLKNIIYKR